MANIKNCLKKKNTIIYKMEQEFTKATRYNSISERNKTRPYSVRASLNNWATLAEELVDLKAKVHETNAKKGMLRSIFLLSELKNQAAKLKGLDCAEGVVTSRYDSTETVKHVEVNVLEKDAMLLALEARIEDLEEKLDRFNHETIVEGV